MRIRAVVVVGVVVFAFGAANGHTVAELSADLSVTLTDSPDPVELRQKLTYTVTVKNQGPDEARDVSLGISLPATSSVEVSTPAPSRCSSREDGLECSVGPLASGTERRTTITVKPGTVGAALAKAVASSGTPDPVAGNNSARATTRVAPARLRLRVVDWGRSPKVPRAGQKLFFAIAVQRSDTGTRLEAGRVTCPAKVSGRQVPVLVRDTYPSPTCVWRIPYGTAGKTIRGSVVVRFRGRTAGRRFALEIR